MSSRQEEKELRKKEREERERAEASAAKRKRLQATLGVVVLAAAAIVFIGTMALSGDDDTPEGPAKTVTGGAPIPAQEITDLQAAVKASGCDFKEFADEGQEHLTSQTAKFDGYKTNPPTSGTHRPPPAAPDGLYTPGTEPDKENWVHTLEHGRILLQYKPGTPPKVVQQLQTLFNEKVKGGPEGYHMVLMQNNTKMTFQIAAVAWRKYIGCNAVDDKTWDALRVFRDTHVDKAPELVP